VTKSNHQKNIVKFDKKSSLFKKKLYLILFFMSKVGNFTCIFYFFLLVVNCYSQSKVKDSYTLFTKEKAKFSFNIFSITEMPIVATDTLKVKFTFNLLAEGDAESINENMFTFVMKYSRANSISAMQHLPENIISKLGVNSNKFPPNYEVFCREKILKNMSSIFKQIESDLKLKKVGFFE